MSFTALVTEPLAIEPLLEAVADQAAGAVVTFVGTVRNHSAGLSVAKLEYHAYEMMAEKELAAIGDELEAEFEGVKVACAHRIGELIVGEAAVICAVSSAHRKAAFEVCQELIDRIKARVPIFKREHGSEGPYWVGWRDARTSP